MMERLTNSNKEIPTLDNNAEYWLQVYFRLKEYENLEEQGLLLKLPCKVGDTVYALVEMNDDGKYQHIKNDIVKSIYISPDNIPLLEFTYIWHDTELSDIGKTVFLTREEAEAKLKEMEGK